MSGGQPLIEVSVCRAPLRLWDRSREHIDGLLREFTLIVIGLEQDREHVHHVPYRLIQVADELRDRYAGLSTAQTAELDDALDRGEVARDFTYLVPAEIADVCKELQDLLDEADVYCAEGELMTLVSPPEQRSFRHWYLQEFVRQIAGEPPLPWPGSLK